MRKGIVILGIVVAGLFGLTSCKNENNQKKSNEESKDVQIADKDKQLNITLLLDLSDRIDPSVSPNTPEHYQRDIAIVDEFVNLFKKDMEKRGAHKAKGRMRVIFSPAPNDPNINKIASELDIDLSKMKDPKSKKEVFDNISGSFTRNLTQIYETTIGSKNYIGSDVWRFFKNDVKDYCVSNDPLYRNVLVIITDGYLYHANSKDMKGKRSAYLLPTYIQSSGLRTPNWREKFDKEDFGFISTRSDLENLEVLVLEIAPSAKYLNDEDIIKAYFDKWFKEMNIKHFELYNTDLPTNTKTRIEKFINDITSQSV